MNVRFVGAVVIGWILDPSDPLWAIGFVEPVSSRWNRCERLDLLDPLSLLCWTCRIRCNRCERSDPLKLLDSLAPL